MSGNDHPTGSVVSQRSEGQIAYEDPALSRRRQICHEKRIVSRRITRPSPVRTSCSTPPSCCASSTGSPPPSRAQYTRPSQPPVTTRPSSVSASCSTPNSCCPSSTDSPPCSRAVHPAVLTAGHYAPVACQGQLPNTQSPPSCCASRTGSPSSSHVQYTRPSLPPLTTRPSPVRATSVTALACWTSCPPHRAIPRRGTSAQSLGRRPTGRTTLRDHGGCGPVLDIAVVLGTPGAGCTKHSSTTGAVP